MFRRTFCLVAAFQREVDKLRTEDARSYFEDEIILPLWKVIDALHGHLHRAAADSIISMSCVPISSR